MRTRAQSLIITFLLVAVALSVAPPCAVAAEQMPPLMRSLLELFPEEGGWFVEGPLGVPAAAPEKVQPFFSQPRVVVPNVDAVQTAVGKLFAAGGRLPVKKMIRYDDKPGEEGLPAVRGIWCQTESKDDIGFWILTPNQNRYLIWAHDAFFPACQVDTIERKVRDWYARSVSEYLASRDFDVPGSFPPIAKERNLPLWLDIYPPLPARTITSDTKFVEYLQSEAEINLWGLQGILAFVPTASTLQRFEEEASDSLYVDRELFQLQKEYEDILKKGGRHAIVSALTKSKFDGLAPGWYPFAVDRYGRIRVAHANAAGDATPDTNRVSDHCRHTHDMLFPGEPLLAAGWIQVRHAGIGSVVTAVDPFSRTYFYSPYDINIREIVTNDANENMTTLGHLFTGLTELGIPFDGCLIRKF